jgi:hypothetical protein
LNITINVDVLKAFQGKSCHSDIVIPIQQCLIKYSDVSSYCPDGKNYSYVCWHVNKIIFAYATGMKMVSIRLGQDELNGLNIKAKVGSASSSGWCFVPYDYEEIDILVKRAYESAKNS